MDFLDELWGKNCAINDIGNSPNYKAGGLLQCLRVAGCVAHRHKRVPFCRRDRAPARLLDLVSRGFVKSGATPEQSGWPRL